MGKSLEMEEMRQEFERIKRLAEKGLSVTDPRHCKQLLSVICLSTSEYVVK